MIEIIRTRKIKDARTSINHRSNYFMQSISNFILLQAFRIRLLFKKIMLVRSLE